MHIKNFLKNKISFKGAIFFCLFFFSALNTNAAILRISSNTSNLAVGGVATISVYLNSEGFAINNVEASIQYPRDLIDVMSISKSGSVFSLWVEEPTFSNASGLINLNGGSPSPGFTGSQGLVVTFLVKAKKAGTANIIFSSAAARADDGLGTDVLNTQIVKTLTIGGATPTPTPKPTTETPAPTTTKAPNTLQITSSSHPNQDAWYKNNTMVFKWNVPAGVTAVQTTVDNNNGNTPHVTYTPAISSKTVEKSKDGVWYFKVRARSGGVWGPISIYIARVDSVDPEVKNVSFDYDNTSKILNINANASDITSGVDHYEVMINDTLVKSIPANEFENNKYSLSYSNSGNNKVKLVVYDKAGNSTESSVGSFDSTDILIPEIDKIPSLVPANKDLVVKGNVKSPNLNLLVRVKKDDGDIVTFETKSNINGDYVVILKKIESGEYEIWSEVIGVSESEHVNTKATTHTIVAFGSFSMYLITFVIILIVLLIAAASTPFFFIAKTVAQVKRQRSKLAPSRKDYFNTFASLRRNLEKHLEILQEIRHKRLLTKAERDMKENIEKSLDEIDKVVLKDEQK